MAGKGKTDPWGSLGDPWEAYDTSVKAVDWNMEVIPPKNRAGTEELYPLMVKLEALRSSKRFVPDKEFSGASGPGGSSRSGPVQFQKEVDDPFGLDAFLDTAKKASKRSNDDGDRRKDDREGRSGGDDESEKEQQKLVESILGCASISGICAGLSAVGLGCSMNNYKNILQYATEVTKSLPDGTFFFLTKGDKKFDADFTIGSDPRGLLDKVALLFSDAYIGQLEAYYSNISHQTGNSSFRTQTIDAVKEVLIHVGSLLGNLAGGARMNSAEVSTVITSVLTALTGVRERNQEQNINNTLCVVEPNPEDPTRIVKLGMIKYSFNFMLKEGKKKFECSYNIDQKSVVFGNPHILNHLYDRIINP